MAVQCCEHLNRALVVEEECAARYGLEIVSVYPYTKGGGGLAAAAMQRLENPVVVESIKADAGMDIGDVFIGMHIKSVGVVVRSRVKSIGFAHLSMLNKDLNAIAGVIMILGIIFVTINIIIDFIVAYLDPRIGLAGR